MGEVLHARYIVSFHHLPSVSLGLLELPAKAQALQAEVDKML